MLFSANLLSMKAKETCNGLQKYKKVIASFRP